MAEFAPSNSRVLSPPGEGAVINAAAIGVGRDSFFAVNSAGDHGGELIVGDLLITNYDSFVSPISVNTRKVLCRKASGVFVFRGISPIWAGFG